MEFPREAFLNCVREDPARKEFALRMHGKKESMRLLMTARIGSPCNSILPVTSVRDLVVHEKRFGDCHVSAARFGY